MENRKVREISLGEVFLYFVKQWKIIIIFAILFATILGAYSYYKSVRSYNATANIQKSLTDTEREYVDKVVEQYKDAKLAQENYVNSYLGKINPNAVYERNVNYYIKLADSYDTKDKELVLNDIMETYSTYLNSQEIMYGIAEMINSISIEEIPYLVSIKYSNRILSITIKTCSERDTETIGKYITDKIEECSNVVKSAVALHSIEEYIDNTCKLKDQTINDAQKKYRETLSAQMDNVKANFASMKYEQVQFFEEKIGDKVTDLFNTSYESLGVKNVNNINDEIVVTKSVNKVYVAIGALFGVFLVAMGVIFKILLTKRIILCDDAKGYGCEIYGPIVLKNKVGKIDKSIYDIHQDNRDEQIEYVKKRIYMDMNDVDNKKITMISSYKDNSFINDYALELKIDGIEINIINGNLRDVMALKAFDEADNILFVERYNKTYRSEYEYEINLSKRNKKNIVGVIMLV